MATSDLGSIFGTLISLGALVLLSVQLAGASMTRFVVVTSFMFTLLVGVWARFVLSAEISLDSIWKFGMLYGLLFIAVFLERAARKEEAENKVKEIPALTQQAKEEGIEIGQRHALVDRIQCNKMTRQQNAMLNAVAALEQLANNSPQAKSIIDTMKIASEKAENDAIMDVASQLRQTGQLMPRNPVP